MWNFSSHQHITSVSHLVVKTSACDCAHELFPILYRKNVTLTKLSSFRFHLTHQVHLFTPQDQIICLFLFWPIVILCRSSGVTKNGDTRGGNWSRCLPLIKWCWNLIVLDPYVQFRIFQFWMNFSLITRWRSKKVFTFFSVRIFRFWMNFSPKTE